jgi:hypothetical protein
VVTLSPQKSDRDQDSTRIRNLRVREKDKWAEIAEFESLLARKERLEAVIEDRRKKEQ